MAGTKITERLEFLTDIITSYDGSEQRIKIRQRPRKFYSFDYDAMKEGEAQWLKGVSRIRQSDTYYVPMWHQEIRLKSDCNNINDKYLPVEDMYMNHMDGVNWIEIFSRDDVDQDGFYLNSGEYSKNSVWQVKEYSFGFIYLYEKIGKKLLKANTFIYPLRKCSLQPINQLNYVFSRGSNVTLNFEDILFDANLNLPAVYYEYDYDIDQFNRFNLPTTYKDKEVFLYSPQWESDSDYYFKVEKNTNKLDTETGIFLYDLKNASSYDIHTLPLILRDLKMIDNLKKFFINQSGRFKSFYAPTWVTDFELCSDIVAGRDYFLTTYSANYKYWTTNTRKKSIVVFTKDWKSYIFEVANYSYVRENETKYGKVILKSPSDKNIYLKNIWMVSFFNLVRFDTDDLTLNYETTEIAHTDVVLREVDA